MTVRFPSIFTSFRAIRNPEIPADEQAYISWILGSGPPPARSNGEQDGPVILSPIDKSEGRLLPGKTTLKWW
jgi:hypothetical protein